jgi:hypothetical protein
VAPRRGIHPVVRRLAAQYNDADLRVITRRVQAETQRLRCQRLYPTPLDLAVGLNPSLTRTPALELVSARIAAALRTPRDRVTISMPPQEGKTTLLQHAVVDALVINPDTRIVYASYAVDLARRSGEACRNLIQAHGTGAIDKATGAILPDLLGIQVRQDHRAQADWALDGHEGGLYCIGIRGGLTGRPADLLIIDDPFKDDSDAWSPAQRARVHTWYQAVATTRLARTAPVIIVNTRWHEDDLTGFVLAQENGPEWDSINIPALADGEAPDALGRPVGEWLVSARGRTRQDWERTAADAGAYVFAALYQGMPAPPEGGIFKWAWINTGRVLEAPELTRRVVWVDPAETGTGDAAGILVAGRGYDGCTYIVRDLSGQYTRAQWARVACLAALRHDAHELGYERTLGMSTAVSEAWQQLRQQAQVVQDVANSNPELITDRSAWARAAALVLQDRHHDTTPDELGDVIELREEILAGLSTGPCPIVSVVPRGTKAQRALSIQPLYETGRVRHVGWLPKLEHEMCTWLEGQASPNRLDTLAHVVRHLDGRASVVGVSRTERRVPVRTAVPTRTGVRR